jgi:hypothetical protein
MKKTVLDIYICMSSSEAAFTQVNGFLIITNNFVTMVTNLYIYCFFNVCTISIMLKQYYTLNMYILYTYTYIYIYKYIYACLKYVLNLIMHPNHDKYNIFSSRI